MPTRASLLWLAATCLALQLAPAVGQNAAESGGSTQEAAAPPAALDAVIVTAQRRAERSQDVPITITDLSADALRDANVQSVSDIQTVTPGFRLDNYGGLYEPTIRGISTSIGCPSCGTDIGIYIDGFYIAHGMGLELPLFNIENVQVLKGPQGTLFGRNTVGGAVAITTAEPSTTTGGYVQASYGSYNTQEYQAYMTAGVSDKVAVDVGGIFSTGNGWVTNLVDNNDKYGEYQNGEIRFGVKADVTDDLSFLFRYDHVSLDDPTGLLYDPYLLNGSPQTYGAYQPGGIVAAQPGQYASKLQLGQKTLMDGYQLTGTLNLGFATLKSYSQYRDDRTPTQISTYSFDSQNTLVLTVPDKTRTITQEFLLSSNLGGRIEWTTGVYYYNSSDKYYDTTDTLFGSPFEFESAGGSDDKSTSIYGNVTYQATDNLFLTAGIRYNHDQQANAFTQLPNMSRENFPTISSNPVTPRAVLRYKFNNDSSTYLSFARGYKSAIYATGGAQTTPVRPEEISAFEIGYKYAAKRLAFDISSFYYDYTNLQLASQLFVNGGENQEITNAASSHMYGSDADLKFEVFRNFQINMSAEWLDAKYATFPNAPAFMETDHMYLPISINAAGNRMERAPTFTGNIGATYTLDVAGGALDLSANFYHSAGFYFDDAQQIPQSAYSTLDLRAAWTNPSGRYTLAVSGKNVTNEKYYTSALQTVFGIGGIWAPPAMVEGSIHVNFY